MFKKLLLGFAVVADGVECENSHNACDCDPNERDGYDGHPVIVVPEAPHPPEEPPPRLLCVVVHWCAFQSI